ncbi:hypothetical protein NLX83_18840 [Allokutzneria sp. A3M-2-11 16]|uniref:hypothetical protein n=1 Tax=Allokutzneria sp. A3M-2-11 16 TaxID=2962043 RepID=UPI0020B8C3B0|nr:hypothetical protein [Allokutzneria sp. A3M-2-11 16]MCP3801322.1 hypothetical protein [Allokutzneria sp. A3M-2-11 16]
MSIGKKLGAFVAAGVFALGVPAVAEAGPTVTALAELPGGSGSGAWGVNNHGVAVGWSNTGTSAHAVRWAENGAVTDLGTLPGDTGSRATAIAWDGTVVGRSSSPKGYRAVRWSPDGAITELASLPGTTYCTAEAVDVHGFVAGHCSDDYSASTGRAVRWAPDGTVTELGKLPGDVASRALGISYEKVVVGWSSRPDGSTRAVRWGEDGSVTELPSLPGGAQSDARGINNGAIAGRIWVYTPGRGGVHHAVRWNADGTVTDLGALPGTSGAPSEARAVTAGGVHGAGTVVGESRNADGRYTAAHWSANGAAVDLGALPNAGAGTITFATAVNAPGVVVGSSGGHAVRWTI